jgi:hypothetical protein
MKVTVRGLGKVMGLVVAVTFFKDVVWLEWVVYVDVTQAKLSQCREVEMREDAALIANLVQEERV